MTDSRDARLAKARERAERRERIATAAMAILIRDEACDLTPKEIAWEACNFADALLAELDRCRAAEEAQA